MDNAKVSIFRGGDKLVGRQLNVSTWAVERDQQYGFNQLNPI